MSNVIIGSHVKSDICFLILFPFLLHNPKCKPNEGKMIWNSDYFAIFEFCKYNGPQQASSCHSMKLN